MRQLLVLCGSILLPLFLSAQTQTTEAFLKKHSEGVFSLFFYKNTLRMLNQKDDPKFDAAIKDIDKMKLMVSQKAIDALEYTGLCASYKKEGYEGVLSSRMGEYKADIFVRSENNNVKGTVAILSGSDGFYIFDLLGKVNPNQVAALTEVLKSSDEVTRFMQKATPKKKKGNKENKDEQDDSEEDTHD